MAQSFRPGRRSKAMQMIKVAMAGEALPAPLPAPLPALAVSRLSLGQVNIELKSTSDSAIISLTQTSSSQIQLDLTNFSGTLVLTSAASSSTGNVTKAINTHNLSSRPPSKKTSVSFVDEETIQFPPQRSLCTKSDFLSARDVIERLDSIASVSSSQECIDAVEELQEEESIIGTDLHKILAQPEVTVEEFQIVFLNDVESCRISDSRGRLPLHVLSENLALLDSLQGQEIAREIALQLMEVFPESLVAEDIDRRIPFQLLIHHWVVTGYKQVELAGRDSLLYLAGIQSRVGSFVKATETRKVLMKNIGKVFGSVSAKGDQGVLDVKSKVDLRSALDLHASLATSDEPFHQFTPVVLTASAAWAFDLLSLGFQLLGSSGSRTMGYSRQRLARSKLATHVASIPVLVKASS
jgi:hypothetical protein